jgi:hypothetical protein
MSLGQAEKLLLFFSYARQDKGLRDKLEEHLSNLKYRELITTWHIREIGAGEDWQQQVDIHLESAHIILLLISASFMASQYCYSMEMTRAIERHREGKARVIPVLLRPVLFTGAPFAMLKMLPTNGKPVASWRNRDSAFVDIALGIERVVREEATKSTVIGQLAPPSQPGGAPPPKEENSVLSTLKVSPPSQPGGVPPQPITPGGHQAGWPTHYLLPPVPSPPRRRRGVLVSLTLGGLSLLLLGLVVAGILFTFQTPNCSSGPSCAGNPNFLSIALVLLAVTLIAILAIIVWRRIIQARRRVKVIEEAEQQRREEARRREQEEAYYKQALQAYDRALHLDPLARRGKGNALAALGRYDEALQSLQLSAVLDPRAATYARIGDVHLALRRFSDAAAAYEQAIALDPQFAPAFASLGDALEQLGRTREAEQAREQAKQLEET